MLRSPSQTGRENNSRPRSFMAFLPVRADVANGPLHWLQEASMSGIVLAR